MTRRSFTLLETILASSLASVVVLGCFAAFGALGRADRVMTANFEQSNDLARLQKTMQRTFTTLVVAPSGTSPIPDPDATEEELAEAAMEAAEAEASGEIQPRPRMLLEPDNDPDIGAFLQASRYRAGGSGSSVAAPQRLEVVLSSVPIRPPAVQSNAWASALVGVEDAAEELGDEEAEQYSGVRGAFVLRPDDPTSIASRRRESRGDDRIGWTLWWQPLDGRSESARVASGLAACQFQTFYNGQMSSGHECYEDTELPRYVQLEVETLNGLYANYLFEIVWTVDELAEEEEEEEGEEGAGGANGQGGDNVTINGNGGGARDGAQSRDGQRRGRPRPNMPQGMQPGQRQDGRPSRAVPGGPGGGDRPGGGGGRPTGPGSGGGGGGRGGGGG